MSATRQELRESTRTRILDACARLMSERGPNGFSMDVLAKEAGVARATVYEHFRSKRVVLRELAMTMSRLLAPARGGPFVEDPLTAMRDLLGEVCRHWDQHAPTVRDLQALAAYTGVEAPTDAVDIGDIRGVVGGLVAAGHVRAGWTTDDATDVVVLLTSYAAYEQLRGATPRTSVQVESLLAKLAASMLTPNAAR